MPLADLTPEKSKSHHIGFELDLEDELQRCRYWFYAAGHTPPHHPHRPLEEYMMNYFGHRGFIRAHHRLSLPYCFSGLHFRYWRGYEFLRASLVLSEEEAEKRAEKYREAIRELIENFDELWARAKEEQLKVYNKYRQFDFDQASNIDLIELVENMKDESDVRMMEHHMYFMDGLGAIYLLFVETCQQILGIDDKDPLFLSAMTGFTHKVFEVEEGYRQLAEEANRAGLKDLITGTDGRTALSSLERSEPGRQWSQRFRSFLWENGWRPIVKHHYDGSWVESPWVALEVIKGYLNTPLRSLEETRAQKVKEREKAEQELLSRVPPARRPTFETLMRMAQKAGIFFEEHDFYLDSYQWALGGYAYRKVGRRLHQWDCLDAPDDIFFLVPDEIVRLLASPQEYSLKALVKRRKAEYQENCQVVPPPFVGVVSLEEAGKLLLQSGCASLSLAAIGELPRARPELQADLLGLPGSPGLAEGPARVIHVWEELPQVQQGEILVAPATSPDWMHVFPYIRAVVTDTGGMLAHAPIVSREFGIPCVSNVKTGTQLIKTGQRIRVDGSKGAVWILDGGKTGG
jgi:pyruvate,water dikinase